MKVKIFSITAIFLVSFGFSGVTFMQPIMASEISRENMYNDIVMFTDSLVANSLSRTNYRHKGTRSRLPWCFVGYKNWSQ